MNTVAVGGRRQQAVDASGQREPGAGRLAVVLVSVVLTAAVYGACVVAIASGGVNALFGLLPWFAGAAIATCSLLALLALAERPRRRLRARRLQAAKERLRVVAAGPEAERSSEQRRALAGLMRRLEVASVALRSIGDAEVRTQLIHHGFADRVERRLAKPGDSWERVVAAGILGQLGAESSVSVLGVVARDPDPDVAYASAQALSRFSAPDAYQAVLDALAGSVIPPARVAALLESFACPTARELLEQRARSADAGVRNWVAYLLGRLADPRSAATINALTYDASDDVRATAAESLGSFADHGAIGRLLADESWLVRCHAAKAAGSARAAELAPQLARLLEDEFWWVRQDAAIALSQVGEPAVAALLPQLHSDDRFARNKAAEVLIRIGYAAQQLDRLQSTNGDAAGARRFLVALGRAEALGTIEAALQRADTAESRERLLNVLDEIGAERS